MQPVSSVRFSSIRPTLKHVEGPINEHPASVTKCGPAILVASEEQYPDLASIFLGPLTLTKTGGKIRAYLRRNKAQKSMLAQAKALLKGAPEL